MEKLTFEKFEEKYSHLLSKDCGCLENWFSPKDVYKTYLTVPEEEFEERLNEQADSHEFAEEFSMILREAWNACSATMIDQFYVMKKLGSHTQYRAYLATVIPNFKQYYG